MAFPTLLLFLVRLANAQSILDVLSSQSSLSKVTSLIASLPQFSKQLNNSYEFTFLAPSNDAIATWLISSSPSNDTIEATLKYHLLDVTLASAEITERPVFWVTALNNTTQTNETFSSYGPRLEAVDDNGPLFISGNKSESRIETQV